MFKCKYRGRVSTSRSNSNSRDKREVAIDAARHNLRRQASTRTCGHESSTRDCRVQSCTILPGSEVYPTLHLFFSLSTDTHAEILFRSSKVSFLKVIDSSVALAAREYARDQA